MRACPWPQLWGSRVHWEPGRGLNAALVSGPSSITSIPPSVLLTQDKFREAQSSSVWPCVYRPRPGRASWAWQVLWARTQLSTHPAWPRALPLSLGPSPGALRAITPISLTWQCQCVKTVPCPHRSVQKQVLEVTSSLLAGIT